MSEDAEKYMEQDILNELISQGKLSIETLSIVTKINKETLELYLKGKQILLSDEDKCYLFELSGMLSLGMELISDDERMTGIIDVLINIYKLDYKTISLYTCADESIIMDIHRQPDKISWEIRYKVAVKLFMIYYMFKYPNYGKIEQFK